MKFLFAVVASAALVAGCSHKDASTSDQSAASSTSATTAADATATDASSSSSADTSASAAPAADASTATTAPAAASAASGAPFVAIDLPVYPGAEKDADKGMSASANGDAVKVDYYTSKDDSAAVVTWYKGHLPSDWQNFQMSSGGKTVGTFASADHGDNGQTVVVTGQDGGGTQIQLSTKTSTK